MRRRRTRGRLIMLSMLFRRMPRMKLMLKNLTKNLKKKLNPFKKKSKNS